MFRFPKKVACRKCKTQTTAVLKRVQMVSGAWALAWYCEKCELINPEGTNIFIAKEKVLERLTPEQIDDLPVRMPDATVRCVRCGERGAELHHWAPKGIFGNDEYDLWPKDFLCKTCHDLWHAKVTPHLVKS